MTFDHRDPGTRASSWRTHPRWPDSADAEHMLAGVTRVMVVAAHPDDETLGAGGLIAAAARLGLHVDLLVLTDGEASHPTSPTFPPNKIASLRRRECRDAAATLGAPNVPSMLGLPDGALSTRHEEEVTRVLVRTLGDARDSLIVAPWRRDGHSDHEVAGRASAAAAVRTGARLWEYPVWFWHWAVPEEAPWDHLIALGYDEDAAAKKAAAVAQHRSQVAPLSPAPGDEALLGPGFLEHFPGHQEVFIEAGAEDLSLEHLHANVSDPWGAGHRWYEQRKRNLVLASLPIRRFRRGLEIGCSRGDLAADLAARCASVIAVDRSPTAIARAQDVVPDNVDTQVLDTPRQWPAGTFDLIVLSEVGYFLSPVALERVLGRVAECLDGQGVVVLCHWLHPIEGWVLDGDAVHELALAAEGLPPLMARYRDEYVEILVLAHPSAYPDPHE